MRKIFKMRKIYGCKKNVLRLIIYRQKLEEDLNDGKCHGYETLSNTPNLLPHHCSELR